MMTLRAAKAIAYNTSLHTPSIIRDALAKLIGALARYGEETPETEQREMERRIQLLRIALHKKPPAPSIEVVSVTEQTMMSVFDYYELMIGEAPGESGFRNLMLNTPCGKDCKNAIDAAAAFLEYTHKADCRLNQTVKNVLETTIEAFWIG